MNIQGWFPLELTDLIFLLSKGLKSHLQHHSLKASIFGAQPSLWFNSHIHTWPLGRGETTLAIQTFFGKVSCLIFNTLFRFVMAILPRSKLLFILWLQSLTTVILEPKKIKSVTVSVVSPSICHEVMGLDTMILVFLIWVLSELFHYPLSLSSRGSLILLFGAERKLANYLHITHSLNTSSYKYVMTNANYMCPSNKM